ncbi:pyridoxamine 5'-phosphate oxidase [Methylophaga sp.]|uniref:pyridoxamine 5'-phosphate oxidase n=1 Tax=Methylophaga sp. TaxID=2024840 RepID=UPI003F69E65D
MKQDKALKHLRKSYEKGHLNENETPNQPYLQFTKWLYEAIELGFYEPNAMTLATADERGRPSCRPVLIKAHDERGLVWFSNYQSRKGHHLAKNHYASLQFYWPECERVIRIEGSVEMIAKEESDAYFEARPLTHRIGAWASSQSEVISGRQTIVKQAAKYGAQFGLNPPRPPHWGGYRLLPEYWEFWQGRPSRLHDRIAYSITAQGEWVKQRLAP